jgi:hypothetical protein
MKPYCVSGYEVARGNLVAVGDGRSSSSYFYHFQVKSPWYSWAWARDDLIVLATGEIFAPLENRTPAVRLVVINFSDEVYE